MKIKDFKEVTSDMLKIANKISNRRNCYNISCSDCPFGDNNTKMHRCYTSLNDSKIEKSEKFIEMYEEAKTIKTMLKTDKEVENDTKKVLGNSDNNGGATSYYDLPNGAKNVQDLIEHKNMNFAQGNIIKAIYRAENCTHSDYERDLNKIMWFCNRELERIKKENKND